jgi:aspartyl-tRNA(Asn)/glutamyl-tRNA(Gln) amidotransferase subunit C
VKLPEDPIRHEAKRARLAVSDEDVAKLAPQLSDIMDYNEQLQSVALDDVPPTSHPFELYNALREDEPRPSLPREKALANAPDTDGEQVRVPAVLEG